MILIDIVFVRNTPPERNKGSLGLRQCASHQIGFVLNYISKIYKSTSSCCHFTRKSINMYCAKLLKLSHASGEVIQFPLFHSTLDSPV